MDEIEPTRIDMFTNLCMDIDEMREALARLESAASSLETRLEEHDTLETCYAELSHLNRLTLDTFLAMDAFKVSLHGWKLMLGQHLDEVKDGRELLASL